MSQNFTARSLVGMTMGARKRAVLTEMDRKDHPEYGQRLDYSEVRAQYRIGQKLRPCAGCLRCKCRSAFDAWPELGKELAKDHPTCDGCGVLPARRP